MDWGMERMCGYILPTFCYLLISSKPLYAPLLTPFIGAIKAHLSPLLHLGAPPGWLEEYGMMGCQKLCLCSHMMFSPGLLSDSSREERIYPIISCLRVTPSPEPHWFIACLHHLSVYMRTLWEINTKLCCQQVLYVLLLSDTINPAKLYNILQFIFRI